MNDILKNIVSRSKKIYKKAGLTNILLVLLVLTVFYGFFGENIKEAYDSVYSFMIHEDTYYLGYDTYLCKKIVTEEYESEEEREDCIERWSSLSFLCTGKRVTEEIVEHDYIKQKRTKLFGITVSKDKKYKSSDLVGYRNKFTNCEFIKTVNITPSKKFPSAVNPLLK